MVVTDTNKRMRPRLLSLRTQYLQSIPSRGYLTHRFDSYPAKMIPHMARFLIEKTSKPGQTILDPFCGSGAVLIESFLSGRNAIGIDLNPLAIIFAKAKTIPYDPCLLDRQLEEILNRFAGNQERCGYDFPNAEYWFTPGTLRKLVVMRKVLDVYLSSIDDDYGFFWWAVAAAIVRQCSRADTRGPKPFISKKAREERSRRHFCPFKLFESKARSWILAEHEYATRRSQLQDGLRVEVFHGDSRSLSSLLTGRRVDAVVTSPPYLNAQDYYRASKLQLFALGHLSPLELRELSRTLVGSDRILKEDANLHAELPSPLANAVRLALAARSEKSATVFTKYVLDMFRILGEIHRVLRDGSYCAIVSAYNLVCDISIPTPRVIVQLAAERGFRLKECYKDRIRDRWVPTIRNGHNGVIDEEHLLVFQKNS